MFHPRKAKIRERIVLFLGLSAIFSCQALSQRTTGPFAQQVLERDREERVAKLVSQMTLEEKVSQMRNHAAAIPRLGIPAYDYWNEGLHGSARSGYSTLFPQAIGLAATWDTGLLHQVAGAISTEARAKHSEAIRHGNFDIYYGLTIWSPNINIFRDPRWGRGQETYGEDPFLTSRLGVAFVTGLQGDDKTYLRTVATPKHFAVHSGPESTRHTANVDVSPKDLEETYLPAFRATITEAHADSLMCAYNAVDGAPACANQHLLQDILRDSWGFKGFVTSDCGAVGDIADGHKYAKDLERAAVDAVRAGTDTSCGTEFDSLTQAVKDGLIEEAELDVAVKRLFLARFRLGMFDPPGAVSYDDIPFSEVNSSAHAQLALQAARESMVLLKNAGNVLPLKKSVQTVAVIGPNATSLAALEGNYNAIPLHPVNPLEGLRTALQDRAKVLYAQGSAYVNPLPLPVPETALSTAGQPGLRGEYFPNTTFTGTPALVRTDKQIDFDWYSASPAPGIPEKNFSIRWTGTFTAPASGDYTFSVGLQQCINCNPTDASAIYLDGKLIVEQKPFTTATDSSEHTVKVHLDDTKPHDLRVEYVHGSPYVAAQVSFKWLPPAAALQADAVKAAQQSDVVIAFVGLSPNLEGEEMPIKVAGFSGGDRTDIRLPDAQLQLLQAVAATGKPLVVVMMNGSAVAVDWAKEHAAAILEAWYPGESGGTAIAETLLGANNPAGRLPVTFYRSIDDLPAFDDYSMKGRTYRYSTAKPLFAFGDGLSFTSFAYTQQSLSQKKIVAGEKLSVTVHVENTGTIDGDEVVEVYLTPPVESAAQAPIRSLIGFTRIHLAAHEGRDVIVPIDPRSLSQVDALGHRAILPGHYLISVGSHQPEASTQSLPLEITGRSAMPE
jgi:beta-glucosidase